VVARNAVTLEELRSHCRELIAYFKLPERLAVVDHIPYSATGKVSRHRIAALIADDG
jgi:acyl-CoA synthetase (AMP-forming)/AMP-acid ligase II